MTKFPLLCAEYALSNLFMTPVTLSYDHSPIKPSPSGEKHLGDNESDSDINDVEGTNINDLPVFQNINQDSGIGKCYNLDFMEMDGTCKHNIKIPLMFTYGAEPESMCNVNEYIGDGAETKPNA